MFVRICQIREEGSYVSRLFSCCLQERLSNCLQEEVSNSDGTVSPGPFIGSSDIGLGMQNTKMACSLQPSYGSSSPTRPHQETESENDRQLNHIKETILSIKAMNGQAKCSADENDSAENGIDLSEDVPRCTKSPNSDDFPVHDGVTNDSVSSEDLAKDESLLDDVDGLSDENRAPSVNSNGSPFSANSEGEPSERMEEELLAMDAEEKNASVVDTTTNSEEDDVVLFLSDTEDGDKSDLSEKSHSAEILASPKAHPFTIGDKVKDSFKALVSKISKDSNSSISKLLTKKSKSAVSTDTCDSSVSDTNKPSYKEGNLFDNLSDLTQQTDNPPADDDQALNDPAEVNPTSSVQEDNSLEDDDDDDLQILPSPVKIPVESVIIDDDAEDEENCSKPESNIDSNMDAVEDQSESIAEPEREASVDKEPADTICGKDDVSSNSLDSVHTSASIESSSSGAKQESVFNYDISRDVDINDKKVRKLSADDESVSNSSTVASEHFKQAVNSDDNIDMAESKVVSNSNDNNQVKADSSSDSKSDIKCNGNDQKDLVLTMKIKPQPPSAADDEASNSSIGSDRKRPALDDGEMGGPTKRSRLDDMIGKLGSHIGIEPEELTVEDQDMEESDTSDVKSEASSSVDEDDKTSSDSSTKAVQLTEKALDDMIKQKIKTILKQTQESIVSQFQKRIEELQQTNEKWKNEAKDLQKQVLDLTVLQQRHDKRKAATAAIRQMTMRNVAVQVHSDGMPFSVPPVTCKSFIPLTSVSGLRPTAIPTVKAIVPTPSAPVNVTAPAMAAQLSAPGAASNNHTVRNLLDATRNMTTCVTKTGNAPTVVSKMLMATTIGGSTLAPRSILTTAQTKFIPAAVPAGTQVVTTQKPGVRIIDLTVDEDAAKSAALKSGATNVLQQQLIRAALPGQVTPNQSSSFLLASSPAGTQLVTQTGLSATRPAGVYQYVISSSTPGVRAGSLVTMLPSNATFRPASTTAVSAPPQLRAVGQSVTSVVRPALTRPPPPLYSAPTGPAPVTIKIPPAITLSHPAPLPPQPVYLDQPNLKNVAPKPSLKISRVSQGIVLSWTMAIFDNTAEIASYQLYAYQEGSNPPNTTLWKKVGDVKALPLPMACTLTQFQEGNRYHFAVRAIDCHNRIGPFSNPSTIHLVSAQKND